MMPPLITLLISLMLFAIALICRSIDAAMLLYYFAFAYAIDVDMICHNID